MRSLKIGSVERYADLERNSLKIQKVLTSEIDSCSFSIKGNQPTEGQEVIVEHDTLGRLFAGTIVRGRLERTSPDVARSLLVWQEDCEDYTVMIDRRLVIEVYEGWTADAIFRHIITKYCSGFTYNNVMTGSPIIETTAGNFNRLHPSECFKWLCNYTGWQWFVDVNKDVHFFDPSLLSIPAPMVLEPSGYFDKIAYSVDTQGLCNKVHVLGGTMLSDFVTYEYKADGVQRAWVLPYQPHEVTVSVGGAEPVEAGEENVDDETAETWMVNLEEKTVRLASGQPNISAGTTVSFTFKYDIPVDTYKEDKASQATIVAIQGGDGVYEDKLIDESLTTLAAANAAGEAYLRDRSNPKVYGSFETKVDGWEPGQLVTINLPERGIDNTYLVQRVTITPVPTPSTKWTYKVEFGGRLIGIPDFLKALVSAQQQKKLASTEIMHFIEIYDEDTVELTDSLTTTPRTPPYICGDADAICGFIECSS
jgi:hypothetical protein